ncbi:MAG: 2-hydroxyacid dehydrogenase [Gaiellaceae bacterium]
MAVQEHMTVMATAPRPALRRGNLPRASVITASGEATFTATQRARLEAAAETDFHRRTLPLAPAELEELAAGAAVLAVTPCSVPRLGPSIIERLPGSLRGIAVFATGVDFVDLEALERREIALANLPDYSAASVAEHTLGLLLTMSRRIHLSRDRVLGRVPAGTSVRGWELAGKTIGIVGVGRIGLRVARLAQALGMRVVAADPQSPDEGVITCDLDELLAEAHVVSLHVPHDRSHGLVLERGARAGPRDLGGQRRRAHARASAQSHHAPRASRRCLSVRGSGSRDSSHSGRSRALRRSPRPAGRGTGSGSRSRSPPCASSKRSFSSGRPCSQPCWRCSPRSKHGPLRSAARGCVRSVGFAYLMLDERFALHERLRDNALAELELGLPWGSPGDYLLVAYLGTALLLLPRLLRLLREEPAALRFFVAGALLAAVAVSADTLDVERMSPTAERLEQTLEEVVEAVSASLLAAALFLVLYGRLAERPTVSARVIEH